MPTNKREMKRYVLANIKIPIVINENGLFDMLNEYTQTEITSLNKLPTIEEEDNLYKKLMEFLTIERNLEEPMQKIKFKDVIEEISEGSEETLEEDLETTMEQVMTICKNNIKMRKHSDNMTFKNIAKGAKSYTRKTYI